ncbi:MAG: site-specific integrase [Bacteroidales bacterium]
MSSTFKILFYLRKNHINKNGKSTIMVRITLNGEKCAFSSKIEIIPDLWDTKTSSIKGRTHTAIGINSTIEEVRLAIRNTYYDLLNRNEDITVENIKNTFLGCGTKGKKLLEVFRIHNKDFEKLVGISNTKATLQKYVRACDRLEAFMKQEYGIFDISLNDIKLKFITDFESYLRADCECSENTLAKYMQRLKRIITMAKNNDWIATDPFANYKIRFKKVDRGYLTEEELGIMLKKEFSIKRLEHVRDIFIFSCFTGLAYVDLKNLRAEHISKSFDGKLWIMTKRQKTDVAVNVPLLPIPLKIIEKYKDRCEDDMLLPIMSNQRLNSYLKEIADVCGINKNLTFHLSRHSFATTVCLSQGVPIETVSKMLGHTNITTTQIYARITNSKISNDMEGLASRIKGIEDVFVG